jgi:hypothetical protein
MSQEYFWNKSGLWKFTMEFLGGSGMASADEYDEYAEQCMVRATKSSNPADKARLLQMAQAWHELAAKLDAKRPTEKDSA